MAEHILIVEDEDTLRESLCRVFEREGYKVTAANSAEDALKYLDETLYDLVITDIILPGISGIELIRHIKEVTPDQSAIVMTAYASMETAVETLRAGAYDYIAKPIIHEEIKQTVRNALKLRALQQENEMLKNIGAETDDRNPIIGNHAEIADVMNRLQGIADTQAHVLIRGELGAGKKRVARAIQLSAKTPRLPFVIVHCAALDPEGEEQIFGPMGTFQRAMNGTLYLDRVDFLSERYQIRLLELLTDKQIQVAGQSGSQRFDARVISGTEKDPTVLVSQGIFLDRLYQLLAKEKIDLPPLRERGNDIDALANFFLAEYNSTFSKNINGFSNEAMDIFRAYSWPGNVLELRNIVERAVLISKGNFIGKDDLPLLQ